MLLVRISLKVLVSLDVTDLLTIETLSTACLDVTLVVNNAGVATVASSLDDINESMKMIQVNYVAPMAIAKSFSTVFSNVSKSRSNDDDDLNISSTAIVNINSIASLVNFQICGTYSASKAGAHSITQAQRRDYAPFHTMVIGVYPGPTDTDMAEDMPYDKVSPNVVADAVLDALRTGIEDVFPDPMSKQLYEQWKADAKALENYMTASTVTSQ